MKKKILNIIFNTPERKKIYQDLSKSEREDISHHLDNLEALSEGDPYSEVWIKLQKQIKITALRKRLRQSLRYAALVLIVVSLGGIANYVYKGISDAPKEMLAESTKNGSEYVMLFTETGDVVDLEKEVINTPGVQNNNRQISYTANDSLNTAKNKIFVPKGGEYVLKLSDGSSVYLNSESMIEFPVNFSGDKREVRVSGEVFFKVAKDKKHPFIVKTDKINVEVTGTQFNVKCYEGENVQATLVEGGINVFFGKEKSKQVKITPNQQAEINVRSGKIEIKEVDVSLYTSWVNGIFKFRDQRLEDIVMVLSRWYDIEVFYRNQEIKDVILSGSFSKYSNVKDFFNALSLRKDIKADIKGKTIILSAKK